MTMNIYSFSDDTSTLYYVVVKLKIEGKIYTESKMFNDKYLAEQWGHTTTLNILKGAGKTIDKETKEKANHHLFHCLMHYKVKRIEKLLKKNCKKLNKGK